MISSNIKPSTNNLASAQVYTTSNVVKEKKYIKVGNGDNNLDLVLFETSWSEYSNFRTNIFILYSLNE